MPVEPIDLLATPTPPAAPAARLGLAGGPLRLRRAWPRATDHLLLEYELGGAIVPGQWFADEQAAAAHAERLPPSHSVAFPLVDHQGWLLLQLHGADDVLPALAPLVARPEAHLLVHQPGRRAVVRLDEPGGVVYAKLVPPKRVQTLAATGAAATALSRGQFDTPALLACTPGAGLLRWSALRGEELSALAGGPALLRGYELAGAALAALHRADAPDTLPAHGPGEEIAVLRRWAAFAAAFAPAIGGRAAELLPDVATELAALPTLDRPIHRDFYDKQVLVGDGRVGLLDFDTLARGDPALDLANALVHIELRTLQGQLHADAAAAAAELLLAGYRPSLELRGRLHAYAAATRLRLACVYALRPRWRRCAEALLHTRV